MKNHNQEEMAGMRTDNPRIKGIMVVGTGRSGTHFTLRVLSGFSNILDPLGGSEKSQVLSGVAKSAILQRPLGPLIRFYFHRLFKERGELIPIDQHHPNLFFLENFFFRLGNVIAVYPERPTAQIVASMMKHSGVQSWYEFIKAQDYKKISNLFPNQFLGLNDISELDDLPRHLLFARRVIAHRRKFLELKNKFPSRIRAINYELLIKEPEVEIGRCFSEPELQQLGSFTLKERPDPSSLVKYLDALTPRQIDEITMLERGEI